MQALDKAVACGGQEAAVLMDLIEHPQGRPTRGARDDTSGDEWLSGPTMAGADQHLTVGTLRCRVSIDAQQGHAASLRWVAGASPLHAVHP